MGKSKVAGKILERPSGLGWRKLHLCSHSSNMLSCLFSMIINTFNFFSMIASHSRLNNLILTWSTCISAGYLYETIFTFNLKRKKERRKWLTDFSSFCLLSSSASPCLLPSCVTLVCHTKTHHCSLCRNGGGSRCPLGCVWGVDSNDGIVPCYCELLRPPRQFNIQSTVHGQNGTALHVCIVISTGPGTEGIW